MKTVAAEAVIVVILFGAGYLTRWAQDGWREAMARVDRLADPSRCDWCDGFTMDRRRCTCTSACTFVPLCGWEANRARAPHH